uniref:translation initiation factor IF-2-like n=1 Tax=Agelaius phoeniceus TaxID=39638 RepID=UPI0023EC1C79|nr:translation initiation factor IF-2-like [Agelaius phoeniceus]
MAAAILPPGRRQADKTRCCCCHRRRQRGGTGKRTGGRGPGAASPRGAGVAASWPRSTAHSAAAPRLGPAPGPRSERSAAHCGAAAAVTQGTAPAPAHLPRAEHALPSHRSPRLPANAAVLPLSAPFSPPQRDLRAPPAATAWPRRAPGAAAAAPRLSRSPSAANPAVRGERRCGAMLPQPALPLPAVPPPGRGGGREPLMEPRREKRSRGRAATGKAARSAWATLPHESCGHRHFGVGGDLQDHSFLPWAGAYFAHKKVPGLSVTPLFLLSRIVLIVQIFITLILLLFL